MTPVAPTTTQCLPARGSAMVLSLRPFGLGFRAEDAFNEFWCFYWRAVDARCCFGESVGELGGPEAIR